MIWKTYTHSIKTRLIINVILIHAVLMGLVVFDMLEREHNFMNNQLSSKGYDLTEILASHTSNALLDNDLVALDELISDMDNIKDHYMVFIMDKEGRVRASQPAEYFNQTLTDSISSNMIKKLEQSDAKNLQNIHSQLIDTYSKIYVDNQLIGYARTILDARNVLNELKVITNKGILYILLAVLFGALFAWLSVRTMTANLNRVTQVANELSKNNFEIKLPQIKTSDEVGTMIKAFGVMQNSLHDHVKTVESSRYYLQNIIDSMPSLLMGVDAQNRVTHWNKPVELYTGISAHDAKGQILDKVMPILSTQMSTIKNAIKQQQASQVKRHVYMLEGKKRFADIMIYPLKSNASIGAVIRLDDISERIQMEEVMMQTEKMMSVGGLAAGMAHEINNPLGGILQGLQNIRRRLSPAMKKNQEIANDVNIDLINMQNYLEKREVIKFMDEMAVAGARAAQIISNMLQFSRRTDNSTFHNEDINNLIEKTLSLAEVDYNLKKKYDFRSLNIIRKLEPGLPMIPCIASQIQQVLLNLIRNSVQAILSQAERKVSDNIVISTYHNTEQVFIEIEDNGPGMSEKICSRVFEPFFSTRPTGVGTGLGLSVSYFIIHDEHGGDMDVAATLGKGTKFTIRLNLKKTELT